MMAKSHQLILVTIFLVLIALLAIAGVAFYNIRTLSLPISNAIGIAGVLLPVAAAAGLQSISSCLSWSPGSAPKRKIRTWFIITLLVFFVIYETAIATLSLTHMTPPDNLICGLDRNWAKLFRSKDEARIRRIQDAHQCCGLHSIKDRAWPFPNRDHGADACANAFNRTKACLGSWRRDEQITAGLLLLVAVLTFLLKLLLLFFVHKRSAWIHRNYSPPRQDDTVDREIGARDQNFSRDWSRIEGPYRDVPALEDSVNEASATETETAASLNHSTQNRQPNHEHTTQPTGFVETDLSW